MRPEVRRGRLTPGIERPDSLFPLNRKIAKSDLPESPKNPWFLPQPSGKTLKDSLFRNFPEGGSV